MRILQKTIRNSSIYQVHPSSLSFLERTDQRPSPLEAPPLRSEGHIAFLLQTIGIRHVGDDGIEVLLGSSLHWNGFRGWTNATLESFSERELYVEFWRNHMDPCGIYDVSWIKLNATFQIQDFTYWTSHTRVVVPKDLLTTIQCAPPLQGTLYHKLSHTSDWCQRYQKICPPCFSGISHLNSQNIPKPYASLGCGHFWRGLLILCLKLFPILIPPSPRFYGFHVNPLEFLSFLRIVKVPG